MSDETSPTRPGRGKDKRKRKRRKDFALPTPKELERRKAAEKDTAKRVMIAALDEALWPEISNPEKRRFVIALCETGNRRRAAKIAGISPWTIYAPTWKGDEAFQVGLRLAEECAADLLEAEAYRRAVEGVEKPAGWYMGSPGGIVREYSDTLLIFLLKGARPGKYAERMEVRGGLEHRLEIALLPDGLIGRIAQGEHPLAVLASWIEDRRGELPPGLLGPGGSPEGDGSGAT